MTHNVELLWFMLTSSNLSQAAWGVLQKGGKELYIKSFEMGVLFHPEAFKVDNKSGRCVDKRGCFNLRREFSNTPCHPILGVDTGAVLGTNKVDGDDSEWQGNTTVVFRPKLTEAERSSVHYEPCGTGTDYLRVTTIYFPAPYHLPGEPYDHRPGGDVPWTVKTRHPGMDLG